MRVKRPLSHCRHHVVLRVLWIVGSEGPITRLKNQERLPIVHWLVHCRLNLSTYFSDFSCGGNTSEDTWIIKAYVWRGLGIFQMTAIPQTLHWAHIIERYLSVPNNSEMASLVPKPTRYHPSRRDVSFLTNGQKRTGQDKEGERGNGHDCFLCADIST